MKKLFKISVLILFCLQTTLTASAGEVFPDVYDSEPISLELQYLVDENVVQGYPDGYFRPLNLINRAEFTKMIVEGLIEEEIDAEQYKNCFNDVGIQWFAKYICYSKEQGWIQGYAGNLFKPADKITKSEAVKIIVEVLDWEFPLGYNSHFVDIELGIWYEKYLHAAQEKNLFDKLDYFISPHELISRKQMTTMLYRAMKYEEGELVSVEMVEHTGNDKLTYQEVLATGIEPAYPSYMDMPNHPQTYYPYGCYAFATKNLMEWQYDKYLSINEVAATIGWDGTFIWSPEEFDVFAVNYYVDVISTYDGSAEFFFKKLAVGDPMILYIPYDLNGVNIGHNVVAYSFDENGVWVSDSLSGGYQHQIGYDEVFFEDDHYTISLTQLRQLKEGATGDRKSQEDI